MARGRKAKTSSAEENDPSLIAMQAPQRIYELKKERAERAKEVVSQAEKEMAAVRKQATACREERQRQSALKTAQRLKKLMNLVEKRRQIEDKVLEVVTTLHTQVQEVEDMMLVGYRGRQREARQSLEALSGKSPHPADS